MINILLYNKKFKNKNFLKMGIGDWGLGIGDWAQSPIPNPQSPIPNPQSPLLCEGGILILNKFMYIILILIYLNF
jgi:hypothetical protein